MLVETLVHLLSDFAMNFYRTSFYERLRSRIFLPKSLCAAVKLVFCYHIVWSIFGFENYE